MKRTNESEPELSTEDRRLIDAIDSTFRPGPMSPTQRVEFRATLDARIARRTHRWVGWVPALASAAALSLWLVRPVATPPSQTSLTSLTGAELYAFVEPDAGIDAVRESGSYLPDDYRALASLYEGEFVER